MEIEQFIGGFSDQGEAIVIYKMQNSKGDSVQLCNIGATVTSICVADKQGEKVDVVLGYKDVLSYLSDSAYLGKTPGRFSNRIAGGVFTLDGKEYKLKQNNGRNHLHGGVKGFSERVWESSVEGDNVVFQLTSADGEEGYPGEVRVEVVYSWSEDSSLEIRLLAQSNAPTIVNLTNHTYFNLNGEASGSVLGNVLSLNASHYLPTDRSQIPTGELASVEDTPMDFREPKELGRDIESEFEALDYGCGYDHCFAVDNWAEDTLQKVGELYGPQSGIVMGVYSTQVGVQVYSGNFLQGLAEGKSGSSYNNREGVAIECQGFPDAPNHPEFPSARLDVAQRYDQTIVYKFGIK